MDQLITIVVVLVISAVATLIKKMKQAGEERNTPPTLRPRQNQPGSAPQPQRKSTSWEEELRRLLDVEAPPAPRPVRPPAPVLMPPPPPIVPAPSVVRAPSPVQAQPQSRPAFRPRVVVPPISIPIPTMADVAVSQAGSLQPAQQAYQQAEQLSQLTSARIDRVISERVQSTAVMRRATSPEAIEVIGLFKSARGARQAVLASIILGPPLALEQSSPRF